VEHHRTGPRLPIQQVEVMLTPEIRDRAQGEAPLGLLRAEGFTLAEASPTSI
jgi:hypothetical protein